MVVQVCDFLQKPLSEAIIDQIVEHSSFASMKKNPMSNPDSLKLNDPKTDGKLSFMRKGRIIHRVIPKALHDLETKSRDSEGRKRRRIVKER